MVTSENIALIDMDGTICDYVGAMNKALEKLRSPEEPIIDPFTLPDNPDYQYLWDRMDLIKENEDWWATLPKFQLGWDIMDIAKKLEYDCEILTQSPKSNPAALSGKLKWILANMEEDMDFTMTRNKARHYGRVLIDDYPGYISPWLEQRPRGLVIMPANQYNGDFRHNQVIRYDGENADEVEEAMLAVKK